VGRHYEGSVSPRRSVPARKTAVIAGVLKFREIYSFEISPELLYQKFAERLIFMKKQKIIIIYFEVENNRYGNWYTSDNYQFK